MPQMWKRNNRFLNGMGICCFPRQAFRLPQMQKDIQGILSRRRTEPHHTQIQVKRCHKALNKTNQQSLVPNKALGTPKRYGIYEYRIWCSTARHFQISILLIRSSISLTFCILSPRVLFSRRAKSKNGILRSHDFAGKNPACSSRTRSTHINLLDSRSVLEPCDAHHSSWVISTMEARRKQNSIQALWTRHRTLLLQPAKLDAGSWMK